MAGKRTIPGPSRRGALAGALAVAIGGAGTGADTAVGRARTGEAAGEVPAALRASIARHRHAWAAFQAAPDGEAGQAEDAETQALGALLGTECGTAGGMRALAGHLRWYVNEEGANLAAEDGPYGRIVRARIADLALALGEPAPEAPPDPSSLYAAISAHAAANDAASAAALAHSRAFDADDPAAGELLRLADAACEADDAALKALRAIAPRDLNEVTAVVEHYSAVLAEWEGESSLGAHLLDGLADALGGGSA